MFESNMAAIDTPTPGGSLESAHMGLREDIDYLGGMVGELEKRLSLVLRPETDSMEKAGPRPPSGASQARDYVEEMRTAVAVLRNRVASLLDRVDL